MLKSLVRKHNAKELNETIHNVFRRLEVGKRHEITTDEDKQAAGSVRQGGAPVDVQPKGPAPAAAAARMPQEIEEEISRDIAKWMPRRDQGPQKQDKDSDVYRIAMRKGWMLPAEYIRLRFLGLVNKESPALQTRLKTIIRTEKINTLSETQIERYLSRSYEEHKGKLPRSTVCCKSPSPHQPKSPHQSKSPHR